ncbi:MAG: energy transducer TonB [Vicingaceae bacterium]
MKRIFTCLLFLFFLTFSNSAKCQEEQEKYASPPLDQMPMFDGAKSDQQSQQKTFMYFREKSLSEKVATDGTVYLRFVVDSTGNVSETEILKSSNQELSNYAIKYAKEMPIWSPGIKNGKKVSVQFTMPIRFKK